MYDANTNTFSNINITTTSGTVFGGAVYGHLLPLYSPDENFIAVSTDAGGPAAGDNLLLMVLASPMTNAGGIIAVLSDADGGFSYEGTFFDSMGGNDIERKITGTSGTVSAVPEPSAFLYVGLIGVVGGFRRYRSRRS